MNLQHDIAAGTADALNVIIEVPKLSRVKYELDKDTGLIMMDRVLYSPMHYPTNYGFVPQTLWDDGDPLDVLVLAHEPLIPGCLAPSRAVALLPMIDSGEDDVKILAVPSVDPRFANIKDRDDIEPHVLEEIAHFFKVYKDLQGKKVQVGSWEEKSAATSAIEKAKKSYLGKKK